MALQGTSNLDSDAAMSHPGGRPKFYPAIPPIHQNAPQQTYIGYGPNPAPPQNTQHQMYGGYAPVPPPQTYPQYAPGPAQQTIAGFVPPALAQQTQPSLGPATAQQTQASYAPGPVQYMNTGFYAPVPAQQTQNGFGPTGAQQTQVSYETAQVQQAQTVYGPTPAQQPNNGYYTYGLAPQTNTSSGPVPVQQTNTYYVPGPAQPSVVYNDIPLGHPSYSTPFVAVPTQQPGYASGGTAQCQPPIYVHNAYPHAQVQPYEVYQGPYQATYQGPSQVPYQGPYHAVTKTEEIGNMLPEILQWYDIMKLEWIRESLDRGNRALLRELPKDVQRQVHIHHQTQMIRLMSDMGLYGPTY